MIPNLQGIVHAVRTSQAWDFTSKAGLCAYSHAVVLALHAADPRFVHLRKTSSQNHCVDPQGRRHAVDAALFVPSGQAVDFIENASYGLPPPLNRVTWGTKDPVGKYAADQGYVPAGEFPPPSEPNPDPEPDPDPPPELDTRIRMLEEQMRSALAQLAAKADTEHVRTVAQRVEAINTRFASESSQLNVHKPLPPYEGEGRVNFWGGKFTVTSWPRT